MGLSLFKSCVFRFSIILGLTFSPQLFAQQNVQRVALVIGNAAYQGSPLANPVNDARAVAARLRGLGFDVTLRENLKTREIGSTYRDFRTKIKPGAVALVFYAGHGLQVKGQNYFPAVDSDIASEEDVPLQSLNLATLLDNMEEAKAGVSLVLLDACRDNPYSRRFRSATRGLAKVEAASGTLIHYATKPGSVAADGDGKNGTYTEALLAQLDSPLPVELMLKQVTNAVVTKTKGKQEPWVEGSLRGDFYFNGKAVAQVMPQSIATPEMSAGQREDGFWNDAKAVGNKEAFEGYLESYPAGRYVSLAKANIARLTPPRPVASPTVVAPVVIPGALAPPVVQIQNAVTAPGERPPPSNWSPSRPVRFVVPFPPGGPTDFVARLIAQGLSKGGQPFVVDNRAGAAGIIGADSLAKSPADGHSLLLTTGSTFATLPSLYASLPFDIKRDFSPILQVAKSPLILVTHPTSGIENPRDLISRESTYASAGSGSIGHLAAESLKRILGAQRAVHVPYKGTAPALNDIIGGTTKWMLVDGGPVFPFIQSGKLRAIALTADTRLAQLPHVPTFQEIGIQRMNINNWIGVWAPASTSPAIIGFYYHEIAKTVRGQQERLTSIGLLPSDMPPTDLARLIAFETNNYGELIRSAGISRD